MPARQPDTTTAPELLVVEDVWAKELRELKELAAWNPDAALAQVAQMPEKHERKTAVIAVSLIIAEKDPAKALVFAWESDLGKLADESAENIALETLANKWADLDPQGALDWARAQPVDEEGRRDRLMKGIALAMAKTAPANAARLVAEKIDPESGLHTETALGVLREWAIRDYPAAITWVSHAPEGPLRDRGLDELAALHPDEAPGPTSK